MIDMARFCMLVALAAGVSRSQVGISGTVVDSRSRAPLAGAGVKLLVKGASVSTGADGRFDFSSTALAGRGGSAARAAGALIRNGSGFFYDHADQAGPGAAGPVDIALYRLSGERLMTLHSGGLQAGRWRISPPGMAAGAYLLGIRAAHGRYAAGFATAGSIAAPGAGLIRLGPVPAGAGSYGPAAAKGAASAAYAGPADSLLVTLAGYYAVRIPLENLQQPGLEIAMTDSAAAAGATVVPDSGWNCGLARGIPPPAKGTLVFQAKLTVGAIHPVGRTPYGHRRLLDITGGTITGDKLKGSVLTGGLDLELTLSNGTVEIEQINILRASDGASIYVRGLGVAPAGDPAARVVLDFEAPTGGPHAWLNAGTYVAARRLSAGALQLDVYDVSSAAAGDPRIALAAPKGTARQPVDCLKLSGTKGASVFTENVTLGSSFSFNGKRGNRNIIPITGGTTTGKVAGKILAGGADYQLNGLDARYTLAPSDGEFVLVRNCGPMGALVPRFEARADGPYAFLNANTFLSSDPGVGGGGVSITFYERR